MENEFRPPQFEDVSEGSAPHPRPEPETPPEEPPKKVTGESFDGSEEDHQVHEFEPQSLVTKTGKSLRLDEADIAKFTSNDFVEEGSLLTNVEEYSRRIREEADQQATLIRRQAELALSEAEEELARAQVVRDSAEKDAAEMIETAENSVEEIERQAYEAGYAKGYEVGLEQAKKDNEALSAQVTDLLAELNDLRLELMRQHETEIVQQTLLMAKKVVHEELKTRPEFVLNLLKAAMAHFEGQGKVRITVHPGEYDFLAKHKPELEGYLEEEQYLTFKKSESVAPSAPLVESDFARVQMDLNRQFEEIEVALRDCIEDRRPLFDPKFRAQREAQKAQAPPTASEPDPDPTDPSAARSQGSPKPQAGTPEDQAIPPEFQAPPEFDPNP